MRKVEDARVGRDRIHYALANGDRIIDSTEIAHEHNRGRIFFGLLLRGGQGRPFRKDQQ